MQKVSTSYDVKKKFIDEPVADLSLTTDKTTFRLEKRRSATEVQNVSGKR